MFLKSLCSKIIAFPLKVNQSTNLMLLCPRRWQELLVTSKYEDFVVSFPRGSGGLSDEVIYIYSG